MSSDSVKTPQFISVEGGEGAGKTTLINALEKKLQSWGFPVVKTREPGGTHLGNEIRAWLLNHQDIKIGGKAELLMFLAARAQHIEEVIAPAIAAGKVVICDRFNDSTIAYQGVGRGLGQPFVQELCLMICGKTIPELTFFLDVDPHIGLLRTRRTSKENARAGEMDRIEAEKMEFHLKVRQAFIEAAQAEPQRFITIDASQARDSVIKDCTRIIAHRFDQNLG